MISRKNGILIVISILLVLAISIAVSTYTASAQAERNLQALFTATQALSDFMNQKGRWPQSASELAKTVKFRGGVYSWPDDQDEILARVSISFDVELQQVAKSDPMCFPFVVANKPIFVNSASNKYRQLIYVAGRIQDTDIQDD